MNWKHSLYEIYAVSFGQAFIIDEAYRILHELREDRQFAIAAAFAEQKRAQAKVINAKATIRDYQNNKDTQANKLQAEAFVLETDARFIIAQPCLDMARVELSFIESLINHIDDLGLRMFPDRAVGDQLVQPLEYAYEYAWSLIYDGSNSAIMRNIFAHPQGEKILDVVAGFAPQDGKPQLVTRTALCSAMAQALNIDAKHLAITVNAYDQIAAAVTSQYLVTFAASSESSTRRLYALEGKHDSNPSGDGGPSS
ncbi:hypothetical protein O152_gp123 [Pseudomonas phage PaBG]|uniref:Uncharacterized protein n=1 Tax=Pseudomonas phage PaBG TaxID=1335230 RepID=S5VV67_9CAUD|nr:hypothetical protein O152_gp123 [Pseudomonas phage PaBG]AGS82007.1 hypothetical protein PaBG_00123 [Pseudomonas phage PaBG]